MASVRQILWSATAGALLASCGSQATAADGPAADLTFPLADAAIAPGDGDEVTPDVAPDGAAGAPDLFGEAAITVGGEARVTADTLNLRSGPGTTHAILTTMPCGATVAVVGGPTTGWWNVTFNGTTGWASGNYLVAPSAFDPKVCVGATTDGGVPVASPDGGVAGEVAAIFTRAQLGVGYSYYWGHGSWRSDGAQHGTCVGNCGNCTHTGAYGADCSGFVAKCWQIPAPSPLEVDLHPYSTYDFVHSMTHWSTIARTSIQPADALVYNANGAGHIVLFESGSDPWGDLWVYEARGCSYGIQHDLRAFSSTFSTIRREGL